MMNKLIIIALLLFSSSVYAVIIGALEQNGTHIRPLFYSDHAKWITVDQNTKSPSTWTMAFDGKDLGKITVEKSKIRLSDASKELIQKYSKKSFGFSFLGKEERRPFVLITENFLKDPDSWKPLNSTDLDGKIKTKLFTEYLKIYNNDSCIVDQKTASTQQIKKMNAQVQISTPQDGYFNVTFQYSDKDIVIRNSYSSKDSYVLNLSMKDPFNGKCSFDLTQVCSTFFVAKNQAQSIINLTSEVTNGCRELLVVDAGDYNNDGTSEILFKDYDYNWDGYLLFDPKTKAKIKAGSGYH
jgi:hypothetical protein